MSRRLVKRSLLVWVCLMHLRLLSADPQLNMYSLRRPQTSGVMAEKWSRGWTWRPGNYIFYQEPKKHFTIFFVCSHRTWLNLVCKSGTTSRANTFIWFQTAKIILLTLTLSSLTSLRHTSLSIVVINRLINPT